ncbi:hypothetical protein H1R20_g15852, partial [Candolleomyces eurysporus]
MLSPTIERVNLGNTFLNAPLFHSYALPLICDGAPALNNLVLHDESTSTGVIHNYWDTLIEVAGRLQKLDVRFPQTASLDTLTLQRLCIQLQNLTSLALDVHTDSHQPSFPTQNAPVLPALQTLHLINRSAAQLCPCYPSFLLEKATSITFSLVNSVQSGSDFTEALDTLSTTKSLRTVEINGYNQYLPAASITPFLHRLQLEEFHVNTRALKHTVGEEPGFQILQSLAQAVVASDSTEHYLKRLTLPIWRETVDSNGHPCEAEPSCYPQLSRLLHVAQHIKGLEHLSISIDSSTPGPNNENVTSMIQNWKEPDTPSSLRYLEIAEMRKSEKSFAPNEYRDIARLLDMIFPNLISVAMIKDERLSNQWDEHWQLIEEYRRMRRTIRLDRGSSW